MEFRYARGLARENCEEARLGRHWLVLPKGEAPPSLCRTWRREPLGSQYALVCHPWARVEVSRVGDAVLAVVGVAVDPDRPGDRLVDRVTPEAPDAGRTLAKALLDYGGTYVVLHAVDGSAADVLHLYGDPAGIMQVFVGSGRAASAVSLLGDVVRDERVDLEIPLEGYDDWYTGSIVPWQGVRSLLANHVLALPSGTSSRFWPRGPVSPVGEADGLQRIAELLRGMLVAGSRRGPLLCSITGGRDSRVTLAALRDRLDGTDFFTLRGPGVKACDLEIPQQLRERHGLPHDFVDAPPPEPWLLDLYDESASGMVVGGARDIIAGCAALAGPDYIHVNGNLGAIAKSYFWPHPWPRRVRRGALVSDFVRRPARIRAGAEEWLSSLPDVPATTAYNLMYFEQKGGRFSGLRDTASGLFFDSLTPFAHRKLFETFCGLPRPTQYGGRVLVELVGVLWPELRATPYCPVTRSWGAYVPKSWKAVAKSLRARASTRS